MKTRKAIVTLGDCTLDVEYLYYPAYRGMRDSLGGVSGAGPALEPDESECIEIQSVITPDDIYDLLSEDQKAKLEHAILQGGSNAET